MNLICSLLLVARTYAQHEGIAEATASKRIFNDGKRMRLLGAGTTLTIARYERAMETLSVVWPADLAWPANVPRPG